MTRVELFKQTLDACKKLHREYVDLPPLESAETQLQYLIDIEEGKRQDRERLDKIILGVIAVREIEDRDEQLASMIYKVEDEVEKMKAGK